MSLRVVRISAFELTGPQVVEVLQKAVTRDGHATLLVPSFAQALTAQRSLADCAGLGMAVTVATPSSWVAERWELWGDGTHIVEASARVALAAQLLAAQRTAQGPLTAGVLRTFCTLVATGLPWLVKDNKQRVVTCKGLTDAERELCGYAEPYARELASHGLVEECLVMCTLPTRLQEAGVPVGTLVLAGFDALMPAVRELVCALAKMGELVLAVPKEEGPAWLPAQRLASELLARTEGVGSLAASAAQDAHEELRGKEVDLGSTARDRASQEAELVALSSALFVPDAQVKPAGCVRVVAPAGPLAEPQAIREELQALVAGGARDIVVCAPDAHWLLRDLAPRLVADGYEVRVQLTRQFCDTEAGRAFLQFMQGVAHMAQLEQTWPEPVPWGKDVQVGIGDMSWWPPRDVTDFLMSSISGVPADKARLIDARWRANRLLSPTMVLDTLRSERETSRAVAQATSELVRGRLGSAASRLLAPFVGRVAGDNNAAGKQVPPFDTIEQVARLEAHEVLAAVLPVAHTLSELGFMAGDENESDISRLVEVASLMLEQSAVVLRPQLMPCEGCTPCADNDTAVEPCASRPLVRMLSTGAAALLPAASTDALVICSLSSHESPIPRDPSVAVELLAALGVQELPRPMEAARARFARLVALPRHKLTLERTLFTAEGKDAYSAVTLTELLACYGIEAGGKPGSFRTAVQQGLGKALYRERSEVEVSANVAPSGHAPQARATETPRTAGSIDGALCSLVTLPPDGNEEGAPQLPVLSASQIETYLECPYKWFSLRRLRLGDSDASFGGAEMGTFVHRVLEVTHRQMLEEAVHTHADELLAVARARGIEIPLINVSTPASGTVAPVVPDLVTLAQLMGDVRIPGSQVDPLDIATLTHAQKLLTAEFEEHLSHQYILMRGRRPQPQALVAHDTQERGRVAELREDLLSTLAYEGEILRGFEPRFFEWNFGREDAVDYAGARLVGTIDRVDVNAHGQAVVVDYKHKNPRGFTAEYDAFTDGAGATETGFVLPRRVQALIYAQVIRRRHPELSVVGALYLATKGDHALAGAAGEHALDAVFGHTWLSARRHAQVAVPAGESFGQAGQGGMEALLDATEEAIAERVRDMVTGDIEARPLDDAACQWCPVLNCARRRI